MKCSMGAHCSLSLNICESVENNYFQIIVWYSLIHLFPHVCKIVNDAFVHLLRVRSYFSMSTLDFNDSSHSDMSALYGIWVIDFVEHGRHKSHRMPLTTSAWTERISTMVDDRLCWLSHLEDIFFFLVSSPILFIRSIFAFTIGSTKSMFCARKIAY